MFVLASLRMRFCVFFVSLSMLLMFANSPSGWPGMIWCWSELNLLLVSICPCFSAVSSLFAVSGILLEGGVPMVLLAQSVMVVWFY